MAQSGPPATRSIDEQRFSLFQGSSASEAALKAWHRPYAEAFARCERVLDVGCGPGYFLDLLRDLGVRGVGLDIDPQMADAARRRGHEAQPGDHRSLLAYAGNFDGVHLSHIIEHLWGDDAVALLEGAYAALRGDGLLIVRTPNWGNETVRNGGFWLDHTHKRPYPLELIAKLLQDIGFDVVQSGFEPGGWQDTFVIARKRHAQIAHVRWYGDFMIEHSLGRVNREIVRQLAMHSSLDLVAQGEPRADLEPMLGLPSRTLESIATALPTIVVRHKWPPRFNERRGDYYVHIQPLELGALPRRWVDGLRESADEIWCYSNYVRQLYLTAGFETDRVHVVPLGVEPDLYRPDGEKVAMGSETTFRFLFVGATVWRKGIDIAVAAYLRAFTPADDVALVVKDYASAGAYRNMTSGDQVLALAQRTDIPAVVYSDATVGERELATLYRRADVLVQPYRGEGFGLPILEAMACGTPAIVPRGGATDDFVDDTTGFPLDAKRVPLPEDIARESDEIENGWVLEIETANLARTMRRLFEDRELVRATGERAAERARTFTWARTAKAVVDRIEPILARPPRTPHALAPLNVYERHMYSQNGEDGILLELFGRLRVIDPFFVEFGVETGVECNAAILARHFGWSGLFMEGDPASFPSLEALYADNPKVKTIQAFVTRDNIVSLFEQAGVPAEFDLLSIDTDGNDYYLWKALGTYRPRVVVVEINPAYPPPQRWVIEYNPDHHWQHDDYYGASLSSFTALAGELGYALIGCESNMVNAFFLRRDLLSFAEMVEVTPEQAFRTPAYRQPHRSGPALAL